MNAGGLSAAQLGRFAGPRARDGRQAALLVVRRLRRGLAGPLGDAGEPRRALPGVPGGELRGGREARRDGAAGQPPALHRWCVPLSADRQGQEGPVQIGGRGRGRLSPPLLRLAEGGLHRLRPRGEGGGDGERGRAGSVHVESPFPVWIPPGAGRDL